MTLTDLQKRKLTRFFTVFDLNKDGFIQRQDYMMLAENIAKSKGFPPHSPLARRVKEVIMRVWENLEILADKNHDHQIILEEFLKYRDKLHQDETKYADLVAAGLTIFDLLDLNKDGKVVESEFVSFYKLFHLGEDLAKEIFPKLDTDSNGYLTREDVLRLGREFDLGDDPSAPGNWLFGPY